MRLLYSKHGMFILAEGIKSWSCVSVHLSALYDMMSWCEVFRQEYFIYHEEYIHSAEEIVVLM